MPPLRMTTVSAWNSAQNQLKPESAKTLKCQVPLEVVRLILIHTYTIGWNLMNRPPPPPPPQYPTSGAVQLVRPQSILISDSRCFAKTLGGQNLCYCLYINGPCT